MQDFVNEDFKKIRKSLETLCLAEANVSFILYESHINQIAEATLQKSLLGIKENLPKKSKKELEVATAYKWLILTEAELEDKLGNLLVSDDLSFYYKVREYELAKVRDKLRIEYGMTYEQLECLVLELKIYEDE